MAAQQHPLRLDRSSAALGVAAVGGMLAQGLLFTTVSGSSGVRPTTVHPQPSLRGSGSINTASDGRSATASVSAVTAVTAISGALIAAAASSRPARKGSASFSKLLRPTAVRPNAAALRATVDVEAQPAASMPAGVRLSGTALAAALKMQCDAAGADYAIYWVNVDGQLVVGSTFTAAGKDDGFAKASVSTKVPSDGCTGPESTVYHLGQPICIQDACAYDLLKRKDLAVKHGVKSICFAPCGGGVLEYGTSSAVWMETPPTCPIMPLDEIRSAFEDLGASYVIFWQPLDGQYSAVADYASEAWVKELRASRGDDKTFTAECRGIKLNANGNGPVSETANLGIAVRVPISEALTLKRKDLAQEYGLKSLHLIPVEGGVLECGITDQKIKGLTLNAALKMRCDSAGACYAIYWTETDGMFSVSGSYVTPDRRRALRAKGLTTDFADASKYLTISSEGDAVVSTCARHGMPTFVADAPSTNTFCRQALAAEYGIESIVCKPVKGGVLEFGTSKGSETPTWTEMPPCPDLPKDEMKKALEDMAAAYVIFWQLRGDHYEVTADFATPDHERMIRDRYGEEDSFASVSRMFALPADGDGYIASAARSGKEFLVEDAMQDAKLGRQQLAQKFGIREVHIVPCKDGVLEYGKATEIA